MGDPIVGHRPGCEHPNQELSICCLLNFVFPLQQALPSHPTVLTPLSRFLWRARQPPHYLTYKGVSNLEPVITLTCQHTFQAKQLNIKFGIVEVYQLDSSGKIVSGDYKGYQLKANLRVQNAPALLRLSTDIRWHIGVGEALDTIDRLYAKCGRRMHVYMSRPGISTFINGKVSSERLNVRHSLETGPIVCYFTNYTCGSPRAMTKPTRHKSNSLLFYKPHMWITPSDDCNPLALRHRS